MAIGTSDGEHYPSQLEEVLSKLDPPRNNGMDSKRDMNEDDVFPNGVPVLPNRNNEGLIDQSPASINDPSKWFLRVEDSLPKNAQPAQYLFSSQSEADRNLRLTPQEGAIYDRHLKNLYGSGGVDNEDGSRSSIKNVGFQSKDNGRYYNVPSVYDGKILSPEEAIDKAKEIGLDKFPSYASQEEAEKRYDQMHKFMEKDTEKYQSVRDTYNKVTDFLDNLSDMKGADKWSPRELIGHALSQGMSALGFGGSAEPPGGNRTTPVTGKSGFRDISEFHQSGEGSAANENIPGRGKADAAMGQVERMSNDEFRQYMADKEKRFQDSGGPSKYDAAVSRQKAGDSADEFIQSLRRGDKPNLRVIENPTQEPQGRPIPGEQAKTQEAQRAANDRNYAMGKGTDRVNVGPGKGVLNDNKEEVSALIRKGSTPSEIARKFDITPMAVRNWIKRNSPITNIDDIPKK
jgi:DNA-binding CsgD family transcriptional regulator